MSSCSSYLHVKIWFTEGANSMQILRSDFLIHVAQVRGKLKKNAGIERCMMLQKLWSVALSFSTLTHLNISHVFWSSQRVGSWLPPEIRRSKRRPRPGVCRAFSDLGLDHRPLGPAQWIVMTIIRSSTDVVEFFWEACLEDIKSM